MHYSGEIRTVQRNILPGYFSIKTEIISPLKASNLEPHHKALISAIPQGNKHKYFIYMKQVMFVVRMGERRGVYRVWGETSGKETSWETQV